MRLPGKWSNINGSGHMCLILSGRPFHPVRAHWPHADNNVLDPNPGAGNARFAATDAGRDVDMICDDCVHKTSCSMDTCLPHCFVKEKSLRINPRLEQT